MRLLGLLVLPGLFGGQVGADEPPERLAPRTAADKADDQDAISALRKVGAELGFDNEGRIERGEVDRIWQMIFYLRSGVAS